VLFNAKELITTAISSRAAVNSVYAEMLFAQENYTKYDGFVVLHGTDTMAYTASALSFMLENLGKPIILTGAQVGRSESINE